MYPVGGLVKYRNGADLIHFENADAAMGTERLVFYSKECIDIRGGSKREFNVCQAWYYFLWRSSLATVIPC